MSDPALQPAPAPTLAPLPPSAPSNAATDCDDCLGCGGWFRYDPAAAPGPGVLYLSCVHCRGSGRALLPRG